MMIKLNHNIILQFVLLYWGIATGCDPCSGIICPEGEVCEFEVINCFTTPCPQPKPRCVGKPVNPCATVLCKPPQVCKVETLPCLIPPCPTRAVCESKICESGEPLIVEYTGKLISCGDESGITCPEPYKCQKSLSDDRQVCCPPKETRCPLRRCIRNCDYYKFDENGCRTCQCIQDPCNDLQCDKEQKCVLQAVHCIRPPCPPAPVCIPDCPLLKCDKNCQYYKYDENRCRTCECDTDDPCLTHKCKPNERCVIKGGYCFKSPCKPLPRLPTCLPECPLYKCADQNCTHYKYDKNGCRTCGCDDRCLTHKCELGQRCELQEVQCIRAPCPPILTCVPCPQVRCANACKYYKYDSNGCQTCQCDDPCLNHKCDLGQRCELENVQCIRAPCPPIPKCVSCLQKNCSNFCKFYKYDSNECQTCECDDRCLTHKCEPGQRCELQEVVCVRAPCLPVPQCIDDPCSTKKCNPGERCEIEELKCIKAPCPVIAKCVAGCPEVLCTRFCNTYKHDAKGCRICECEDTCLSKKCKPGERCILDKVFCKKPPCPPRPICIPECPLVDCLNYCESYKRDEKGCQTCECNDL